MSLDTVTIEAGSTLASHSVALTITAPQQATDAPVLVYIHGGRYENGTHEDPRAHVVAQQFRPRAVRCGKGQERGLPSDGLLELIQNSGGLWLAAALSLSAGGCIAVLAGVFYLLSMGLRALL